MSTSHRLNASHSGKNTAKHWTKCRPYYPAIRTLVFQHRVLQSNVFSVLWDHWGQKCRTLVFLNLFFWSATAVCEVTVCNMTWTCKLTSLPLWQYLLVDDICIEVWLFRILRKNDFHCTRIFLTFNVCTPTRTRTRTLCTRNISDKTKVDDTSDYWS